MSHSLGRFRFIFSMLVISSIVSWKFYLEIKYKSDTINVHSFPKQVGEWKAQDSFIPESYYALLETRNIFLRRYTDPSGRVIDLFVVYSQYNRKSIQPPEVYYTGDGVTIRNSVHDKIRIDSSNIVVSVNKLYLEDKNVPSIALYWFKVGDSFSSNYFKQQILIAVKTLLGKPSSSALIRISAVVDGDDFKKAEEDIKEFSRQAIPLFLDYL